MIKVAVLNRDMINSHPGGDITYINNLNIALGLLGVERTNNPNNLGGNDIVHCYHVNFGFAKDNLQRALANRDKTGAKVVVTTIFFDDPGHGTNFSEMVDLLDEVDAIICHTPMEAMMLRARTGLFQPVNLVHPGVHSRYISTDYSSKSRSGVITVASRGIRDKGGEKVEKACERLGLEWIHPINLSEDELVMEYKRAKVFVFPLNTEFCTIPMALMEALASGCRCISSYLGGGISHIPGLIVTNPNDPDRLDADILIAHENESWNYGPNKWATTISWDYTARRTLDIYQILLDI